MAHQGLLGPPMEVMVGLGHDDLALFPAEHMVSLISNVMGPVCIWMNVLRYDPSAVLGGHPGDWGGAWKLSSDEIQALVQKMETRVELAILQNSRLHLHIEALTKYSGQGKCKVVSCDGDKAISDKLEKKLKTWAKSKNWVLASNANRKTLIMWRI